MKRVVTILPDNKTLKVVVKALRKADIPSKHIYVVAKQIEKWMSDFETDPEVELAGEAVCTVVGGATLGTLGALLELPVFILTGGFLVATGAALGVVALGMSLADWLAELLVHSSKDKKIADYQAAIEEGKVMVIAEVPDEKMDIVSKELNDAHATIKVDNVA